MKILAIDTSTTQGSVSLFQLGSEIITRHSTDKENYSSRLFRWLEEVKEEAELEDGFLSLGAVVVSSGPGTFTGLRVGIATAKAIAIAAKCELLHFPTLDVMAEIETGTAPLLRPMVIAGRGEIYTALYEEGNPVNTAMTSSPDSPELIPDSDQQVLFFGNGTELLSEEFRKSLPVKVIIREGQPALAPMLCQLAQTKLSSADYQPKPVEITYVRSATS